MEKQADQQNGSTFSQRNLFDNSLISIYKDYRVHTNSQVSYQLDTFILACRYDA